MAVVGAAAVAGCSGNDVPAGPSKVFAVDGRGDAPAKLARCRTNVGAIPSGHTCRYGRLALTVIGPGDGADVGPVRVSVIGVEPMGDQMRVALRVENRTSDAVGAPAVRLATGPRSRELAAQPRDNPFPLGGQAVARYRVVVPARARALVVVPGPRRRAAGLRVLGRP